MPKTAPEVLESRRNADVKELAKGPLGTAIASLGKKGLNYDEAPSVTKAKRSKDKIAAAASLIAATYEEQAQHLTTF